MVGALPRPTLRTIKVLKVDQEDYTEWRSKVVMVAPTNSISVSLHDILFSLKTEMKRSTSIPDPTLTEDGFPRSLKTSLKPVRKVLRSWTRKQRSNQDTNLQQQEGE